MTQMDDHRRRTGLPAGLSALFGGDSARTPDTLALSEPLPDGMLVWPDASFPQRRTPTGPAFWVSDDPMPAQVWSALRAEHHRSGLWPVLLDDSTQPWSAGLVAPEAASDIDDYDPAAFMAEVWADYIEAVGDDAPELAPYGRICPGPAAPAAFMGDPAVVADWYAHRLAADTGGAIQLGLVAARRSSDVPAVMGWQGAVNHNEWIAPLAAVLRSWEERFGVRLVRVGFNTLDLSVAAPPTTVQHALHVAAEHWAFCPDNIGQGPGDLRGYAEQIAGRNTWSFWWD